MSTGKKIIPLVEEIPSASLEKKDNDGNNNIEINISKKKSEEDDKSMNSAECSGKELKSKEKENDEMDKKAKPIKLSKKAYERYTERLKERSMRIEADKIFNETERLRNKYDEKNSFLHKFDNNPQFQKMLKSVNNQLKYFFIEGVLLCTFSALIYFYITRSKEGLALTSFILSISEIAICIILFGSMKLGLLSDPYLSKAFRLFIIIEFLLLLSSFVINFTSIFVTYSYFKKYSELKIRIIIYIILLLIIILFISTFKLCLNLFFESVLILLNRKTEYSILMLNEEKLKNEINFNINMSTVSNNITSEPLKNESTDIFDINNNNNNNIKTEEENKEEEQYRNFSYFNKFHYSVTSSRNKDYGGFKK